MKRNYRCYVAAILFFMTARIVPQDIENLRQIMAERVKEIKGDVI
jgi:hypothetical protein